MDQHLSRKLLAGSIALALFHTPALADETSASTSTSTTVSSGGWNFTLAPLFLWGMSIDGNSTLGGETLPLELDFNDLLSDMSAVFTLHFEAQKDDLTLFTEIQYSALEPSTTVGPVSVDVDFKNIMGELGAAYRLGGNETTDWEILGGARYFEQDMDINLGRGPKIKADNNWWNGFFGGRVRHQLSERWSIVGRLDYGLGSSSNYSGNALALFDYRFKDWGSAFVGYKYMKINYDNNKNGPDNYKYNAVQQGPLVGLSFYW